METSEMSLAVLRVDADTIRGGGVWRGFRWPEEFKQKVRALHEEGVSAGDIAAETRIPIDSVKAWVGTKKIPQKRQRSFIEVPVKESAMSGVSITLDGGKRIEGLRVEDLRELLLSGAL